ncbi:hypothetical protein MKQ70_00625 [Chitinophaga sedimenti]|uniref:hypothetical protein n=1 Tax=Chitinophaga sedimenti TaxID=2033606 RepID=UPI002005E871|nr:hypothetical protein [Chitinophaga sedimenti]MCK7553585.1 hypothetical protein [Chitinophaga sedimenti]
MQTALPHIPVQANGWQENNLQLVATTNWQPYTWSINNVALAENLHTALAYWQGNRAEEGFGLFRSSLLESMYLGASPGNFQQLSFYDAVRGELYRDFADPIGMAARALVEGLFGVQPDALNGKLRIQPGLPSAWNHASLEVPDVKFQFRRQGNVETYSIQPSFAAALQLELTIPALKDDWESILLNGKTITAKSNTDAVGRPQLVITAPVAKSWNIVIRWKGRNIESPTWGRGGVTTVNADILKSYDPQQVIVSQKQTKRSFTGDKISVAGQYTFFLQMQQGRFSWWQPINFENKRIAIAVSKPNISDRSVFEQVEVPFNDKVTQIFSQRYLAPRPAVPTLQLPTQGIGNWCYPNATANIDDSGLRQSAGARNEVKSSLGIPFRTPADTLRNNILFTSMWENYPSQASIALKGKASHIWFLMAGSTNAMQSRLTNGQVTVEYADGSKDTLALKNPENWWPIEQDYMNDDYAFTTGAPLPERLHLKTGEFTTSKTKYDTIKGFSNRSIDGGAATVLDMPLQSGKELHSITLHTLANDVVIGLMAATLLRN